MEKKLSAFRHLFGAVCEMQEASKQFVEVVEEGNVRLRLDEIEQLNELLRTMGLEAAIIGDMSDKFKEIL